MVKYPYISSEYCDSAINVDVMSEKKSVNFNVSILQMMNMQMDKMRIENVVWSEIKMK